MYKCLSNYARKKKKEFSKIFAKQTKVNEENFWKLNPTRNISKIFKNLE